MSVSLVGSLIIYMLVSSFTPGPGNILALNTTARYGWNRGKILFTGICCGYLAVQLTCILMIYGLGNYLSEILNWLKYIGAAYLIYLAISIIKSKPKFSDSEKNPSFWSGFLLQLANVKIYFYGMTVLSVYIYPHFKSLTAMILMQLLVVLVGSLASLTWALIGLKIKKVYVQHYKFINILFALALLFCVLNILIH